MKKTAILLVVVMMLSVVLGPVPALARDDTSAIILSLFMPGVGEWYNSGFDGAFPLGECVVGTLCCFVQISSVVDAAAGKSDKGMRFDFWGEVN